MTHCPSCGKDVEEEDEFCSNCGRKLSNDTGKSDKKSSTESAKSSTITHTLRLGVFLILAILAASIVFDSSSGIDSNSLEIVEMEWNADDDISSKGDLPIFMSEGNLVGKVNLVVNTKVDELNGKVYAGDSIVSEVGPHLDDKGRSTIELYDVPIESIGGQLRLEVCFSKAEKFSRNSKDSYCKDQTIRVPEPSIEVEPNTVDVSINLPEEGENIDKTEINVKNAGEMPVRLFRAYEKYYNENSDQGLDQGFTGPSTQAISLPEKTKVYRPWKILESGEDASFDLRTRVTSDPNIIPNTEPGYYAAKGYIFAYTTDGWEDAEFKTEFDINTQVIE